MSLPWLFMAARRLLLSNTGYTSCTVRRLMRDQIWNMVSGVMGSTACGGKGEEQACVWTYEGRGQPNECDQGAGT